MDELFNAAYAIYMAGLWELSINPRQLTVEQQAELFRQLKQALIKTGRIQIAPKKTNE